MRAKTEKRGLETRCLIKQTFGPVSPTETEKCGFALSPFFTDAFGDLEGESKAVFQGSTIFVIAVIREWRDKAVYQVSMSPVDL